MRADEAQAAIARRLVDPGYLGDETALPPALQADLRLFRGFITRVKHTQLRRVAPLTLRLLALHRLDIAFFADYAPSYQRARAAGAPAMATLFMDFASALRERASEMPPPAGQQIEAMLRHETAIWEAGRAGAERPAAAHPRLRAGIAVERYRIDVLALAAAVEQERFAAPASTFSDQSLLYRTTDRVVAADPIDALSGWLLSRLDGATSMAVLARALSGVAGGDAREVVADLIADAGSRGWLEGSGV